MNDELDPGQELRFERIKDLSGKMGALCDGEPLSLVMAAAARLIALRILSHEEFKRDALKQMALKYLDLFLKTEPPARPPTSPADTED
jgi:hypothetical protein